MMTQEPSDSLFDSIISSITQEKEAASSKHVLLAVLTILFVSLAMMPFSVFILVTQWNRSGVEYFISTAVDNIGIFMAMKQDFALSILEALPIIPIALFIANVVLLLFSLQLFLYKKAKLLKYLIK